MVDEAYRFSSMRRSTASMWHSRCSLRERLCRITSRVCHGLRVAYFQLLLTLPRCAEHLALMHFLMPDRFPLNADFETKSEHILCVEMSALQTHYYENILTRVRLPGRHSVEVMVYQYDKLLGYGCWMTSIPTMSHILIFLGYSEFPIWLPWEPIQILQYPKSIQQNIKMWDMVGTLVIQQPYPKSLSY